MRAAKSSPHTTLHHRPIQELACTRTRACSSSRYQRCEPIPTLRSAHAAGLVGTKNGTFMSHVHEICMRNIKHQCEILLPAGRRCEQHGLSLLGPTECGTKASYYRLLWECMCVTCGPLREKARLDIKKLCHGHQTSWHHERSGKIGCSNSRNVCSHPPSKFRCRQCPRPHPRHCRRCSEAAPLALPHPGSETAGGS